jgi:hypothetical protein
MTAQSSGLASGDGTYHAPPGSPPRSAQDNLDGSSIKIIDRNGQPTINVITPTGNTVNLQLSANNGQLAVNQPTGTISSQGSNDIQGAVNTVFVQPTNATLSTNNLTLTDVKVNPADGTITLTKQPKS